MHDAHTQKALACTVFDKVSESWLGLRNCHTVQVNFRLHAVTAAGQFAHRAAADRRPLKVHSIGVVTLHGIDVAFETLTERLLLIGPCKMRFWRWLFLGLRYTLSRA